MSADGTISAGATEPEPDWVEVMTFSDFIDSMPDPDRRDLVEEYARRNGIDLSNPLGEGRP
jgi:hypothetical protein